MTTKTIRTIGDLERMRNTTNGNPRWRVSFTDGTSATTEADSACASVIDNSEYTGVPLKVEYRRGQVCRIELAADESATA